MATLRMMNNQRYEKEEPDFDLAKGETAGGIAAKVETTGRANSGETLTTKIAIVMSGRNVSPHFGQSEEVMIIEVESGNIKSRKVLDAPPRECGSIPALLKEHDVKQLVTGNIGARALESLKADGIRVYSGAKGKVEDTLGKLLSGVLASSKAVCGGPVGSFHGNGHKAGDQGNDVLE